MKQLFSMLLALTALFFAHTAFAYPTIPDSEISLGGIPYGASEEYVLQIYGQPTEKESFVEEGGLIAYTYGNSFKVFFEIPQGR